MKKLFFLSAVVLALAIYAGASYAEETTADVGSTEDVELAKSLAVASPTAKAYADRVALVTSGDIENQQPIDTTSSTSENGNLLEQYGVCWNDR